MLTLEPLFSKIEYRSAVVHVGGMYFERRRFGRLGQKWVNFSWSLCVEFLCSTFSFVLITCFSFCFGCPFIKNRIFWFGFAFRLFCVLFDCGKT